MHTIRDADDSPLQLGRGYPRPLLRRNNWQTLNGEWEFALDPTASGTSAARRALGPARSACRSPRRRRRAASATPASIARAGTGASRSHVRPLPHGSRCCCTSAPSTTTRRSGSTAARRRSTRAATRRSRRHHRCCSTPGAQRDRRARRRRPARPRQAARQAGLAARAALDLVSAHDRHLADGLAGARARDAGSAACAGRRTSSAGRSASRRWLGGRAPRATAARACSSRVGEQLLADDTLHGRRRRGAPAHRAVRPGHRRLPQRAALEPRVADADRGRARALGRARRAARRGRAATPRCARSPSQGDRFVLNGRPLPAAPGARPGLLARRRGLTAPDDAALRRDVELAKAMGFNGVRKHQKIEDPRYLYWADRLGLLVWEEMPSAYRFTQRLDRARHARVDRGDRARLQPSVHRRLGAVQRVVGRARTCPTVRPSGTTSQALYHLTQDARPDAAGDRQRRLGERRDRHHRHPRLRRRPRAHRAALPRRGRCCRGCSGASGPAAALLVLEGAAARRTSRSCSPSSAASRTRRTPDDVGLLAVRERRGARRSATRELLRRRALARPARRLLLHAVRRHVPGGQRPAVRRPHAEVPARADRRRDARVRAATPRPSITAPRSRPCWQLDRGTRRCSSDR